MRQRRQKAKIRHRQALRVVNEYVEGYYREGEGSEKEGNEEGNKVDTSWLRMEEVVTVKFVRPSLSRNSVSITLQPMFMSNLVMWVEYGRSKTSELVAFVLSLYLLGS